MKQLCKMVLPLILLFAFASTWANDLGLLQLSRTMAYTDTVAHAQVVTAGTTGVYRLNDPVSAYTRWWIGYRLEADTTWAAGAQGDSLTLVVQHSPDGVNNWTHYDSTHLATLAGNAYTFVTNSSIKTDSVATMSHIRIIMTVVDSLILDSTIIGDGGTYRWNFRPYLFPAVGN